MSSIHNSEPDSRSKKSEKGKIFYKCFYEKHFKFYTIKPNLWGTVRIELKFPKVLSISALNTESTNIYCVILFGHPPISKNISLSENSS